MDAKALAITLFLASTLAVSLAKSSASRNGSTVSATSTGHVMINEFDQNPPGWDYEGGEWAELFNPEENDVDIGGWKLSTTHEETVTVTIPEGTEIAAGEFWVYTHETQWLSNEDESIILQDADGNEIDRTPTSNDAKDDKRCWARYPNGRDTDSDNDWTFVKRWESTKGYSNTIDPVESGDKQDLKVGEKRMFRTFFEVGIFVAHYNYEVVECPDPISYSASFTEVLIGFGGKEPDYIDSIVHVLPSAKLGVHDLRVKWAWSSSPVPPEEWNYVHELHLRMNIVAPTSKFETDVLLHVEEDVVSPGTSVGLEGKALVYDREGEIYPLPSTDLTLVYEKPDGTTFNQTVLTGEEGEFSHYGVYDIGAWKVKASLKGDSARQRVESSLVTFKVVEDITAPVANAGPDQTVDEDAVMTFNGSGSFDNIGVTSYTWTFMDVTPQTLTGVNPTYTFTSPGTYTVILKVSDAVGNVATDTITITVLDITRPTAARLEMSTPEHITEDSVLLNWTKSEDTDFDRYEIYQSTSSGILGAVVATIADKETTSCRLPELSSDTTYYFTVRVIDSSGLYTDSNQLEAKTEVASVPGLQPEVMIGTGAGITGIVAVVALIVKAWKTGKGVLEIIMDLKKIFTRKEKKGEENQRT